MSQLDQSSTERLDAIRRAAPEMHAALMKISGMLQLEASSGKRPSISLANAIMQEVEYALQEAKVRS